MLDSSTQNAVLDDYLGPLLVSSSEEETVTLFTVVTADPCPTIQWMFNGSNITQNAVYTINDPCPSPGSPGSASYNFTLTVNLTMETAGVYNAAFTNPAGTSLVAGLTVTPPCMLALRELYIAGGLKLTEASLSSPLQVQLKLIASSCLPALRVPAC